MLELARSHEVHLSVPAHPSSLVIVRRAVEGFRDLYGDELTDKLAMIFSELITNSIRHGGLDQGEKLDAELEMDGETVRGRVVDPGVGFDPGEVPERRPVYEGGFGLRIVDELATRWGVEMNGRTEVWFEI